MLWVMKRRIRIDVVEKAREKSLITIKDLKTILKISLMILYLLSGLVQRKKKS